MCSRHLVVFLCDQLRPDFLSLYNCKGVPTPHLDRLAAKGIIFDRAITASTVCAPARASIMTGRYVSDHEVWTNDLPFRKGMEYLPQRMNDLGYATGAFGKLHHYPALDSKGFQVYHPMEEGRLGEKEPYLQWLKKRHPQVTDVWNYHDYTFDFEEDEYHEHWIASRAIDFIENQTEHHAQQPFLAWISFQGPHTPLGPPREVKGTCDAEALPTPLVRTEQSRSSVPQVVRSRELRGRVCSREVWQQQRIAYAELIVEIDRQIGRVLQTLDNLGLTENTTFLFTSDHGDLLGDYDLNAKGPFPYRGQMDIPLMLSNHPNLPPGSLPGSPTGSPPGSPLGNTTGNTHGNFPGIPCLGRSNQLVSNIDIASTLLDIAGDKRPLGLSRSLLDLAQPHPVNPREVNFSEFCDSIKTVEDARYRLSYYPFTGESELYDMIDDPDQTTNLAAIPEMAQIRARLLEHLVDFAVICKGVRVEASDFIPKQQEGLAQKNPDYQRDFPVAFPLTASSRQALQQAGFPADYNAFCKNKPVLRNYRPPYWDDSKQPTSQSL